MSRQNTLCTPLHARVACRKLNGTCATPHVAMVCVALHERLNASCGSQLHSLAGPDRTRPDRTGLDADLEIRYAGALLLLRLQRRDPLLVLRRLRTRNDCVGFDVPFPIQSLSFCFALLTESRSSSSVAS